MRIIDKSLKAIFLFICLFLTYSCKDFGNLSQVKSSEINGIKIIIALSSERTVLPEYPDFTRFSIEIFSDPNSEPIKIINTSDRETFIDIQPGTWIVSTTGYAIFEGIESEVAQSVQTISITNGNAQTIEIILSPILDGPEGILSCTISLDEGIQPTGYNVSITPFQSLESLINKTVSLPAPAESYTIQDEFLLQPGYYLLRTNVYTEESSQTEMEVVYVASNLVSNYQQHYFARDFLKFATIRGALDISFDGITDPIQEIWISIDTFTPTSEIIGEVVLEPNATTWEIKIVKPTESSSINITAYLLTTTGEYIDVVLSNSLVFTNESEYNFDVINHDGFLQISGDFKYILQGVSIDTQDWLLGFVDETNTGIYSCVKIGEGGLWKKHIQKEISQKEVFFNYDDTTGTYRSYFVKQPIVFSNESIENIHLTYKPIHISGTYDVTINGSQVEYSNIFIGIRSNLDIIGEQVTLSPDGNWYAIINPPGEELEYNITFIIYTSDGSMLEIKYPDSICIFDSDIENINLAINSSTSTMTGTLDIQSNSTSLNLSDCSLELYDNTSQQYISRSTFPSNENSWSMTFNNPNNITEAYFILECRLQNGALVRKRIETVYDVIQGINESIPISENLDLLSLSGSIINWPYETYFQSMLLTEPDYMSLISITDINVYPNWDMQISSSDQSKDLYFAIRADSSNDWYITKNPISLANGLTGIELNFNDFELIDF